MVGILRRLDRFHKNSLVVIRFEPYGSRNTRHVVGKPVKLAVDQRSPEGHLSLAVGPKNARDNCRLKTPGLGRVVKCR